MLSTPKIPESKLIQVVHFGRSENFMLVDLEITLCVKPLLNSDQIIQIAWTRFVLVHLVEIGGLGWKVHDLCSPSRGVRLTYN